VTFSVDHGAHLELDDLVLGTGAQIVGQLVARNGGDLAGYAVELMKDGKWYNDVHPGGDAVTQSDGQFVLDSLAPGLYDIYVYPQQHVMRPWNLKATRVVVPETERVVSIEISVPGITRFDLRGVVVYNDSEPVAWTRVNLGRLMTTTDGQGKFFFDGVQSGEYALLLVLPDGVTWAENVEVPRNGVVRVVVPRPGGIRGEVDCGSSVCEVLIGVRSPVARVVDGEDARWERRIFTTSSFSQRGLFPNTYVATVKGRHCQASADVTVTSGRETPVFLGCGSGR